MDPSMKISRRRTLTYFQSGSPVMTRAAPNAIGAIVGRVLSGGEAVTLDNAFERRRVVRESDKCWRTVVE